MSLSHARPTRHRRLRAVSGAAALTVAAVTAGTGIAGAAVSTTASALAPKVLTGAVVPHLDALKAIGAVDPAKRMTVGVSIPGNSAALQAASAAFANPKSASYQHVMTQAQVAAAFGVAPAVSSAVQSSVESDGLTPVYVAKDGTYVELTGTAAQVEKTFKVSLENYSITTKGVTKTWFANTNAATVPSAVSAVLGLSDLTNVHTDASQDICLPAMCTGVVGPSALWGTYDQPDTYTEGQSLKSDASNNYGQGQKVAIFGEGDLVQVVKDLRLFEDDTTVNADAADLKPVLPHIPVAETLVNDDQADTGGLGEWDLDSQSSTGMSPDLAQLQFYFGEDLSDAAIAGIYSAWVNDANGAAIGNSSFGGCEPLEGALGDESTDDAFFQQAVMMGRTMFASTGDTGSGGCVVGVDLNGLGNGGAPAVEYPSASPYVVAVGGTVVYTTASTGAVQTQQPSRAMEYAWTYTGGGNSDFEPQNADQAALGAGSMSTQPCVMPTGSICRSVPDVAAMSGDVATNGYGIESNGAQTETGGTSLSSPLWAGMWARVRAAHGPTCLTYPGAPAATVPPATTSTLGFAQHLLYQVAESSTANDAAAFFDIGGTSGKTTAAGNGTYVATPRTPVVDPTGYDLVSGLGTPDLSGLIKILDCQSVAPTTFAVPDSTAVTFPPVSQGSCTNGVFTDAAGDETPADTATDISSASFTSNSSAVTFVMKIATLPESNPSFDDDYDFDFTFDSVVYEVEADNGNPGGTPSYTIYTVTNNGTTTSTTSIGTVAGSFVNGSPGTVTITVPFSTFNADAKVTPALGLGSTLTAVSMDTATAGPSIVNYSDTLTSACSYQIAAVSTPAPPPTLPEIGAPALLVVLGGLGGLTLVRRRRRSVA